MLETIREYAAADAASVAEDAGPLPYRADLDVVTCDVSETGQLPDGGTWPAILVRPDGHVAARGRRGSMQAVTGYLRYLFTEPAGWLEPGIGTAAKPGLDASRADAAASGRP